jgi:hypothetical protein
MGIPVGQGAGAECTRVEASSWKDLAFPIGRALLDKPAEAPGVHHVVSDRVVAGLEAFGQVVGADAADHIADYLIHSAV